MFAFMLIIVREQNRTGQNLTKRDACITESNTNGLVRSASGCHKNTTNAYHKQNRISDTNRQFEISNR